MKHDLTISIYDPQDAPKVGTVVTISFDRVDSAAAEGTLPERWISEWSENKTVPASGFVVFNLRATEDFDDQTRYTVTWRNPEGGGAYTASFIMPQHPTTLRQAIRQPAILPQPGQSGSGHRGVVYYAPTAPLAGDDDDWWIETDTDPWTAHIRRTGAWHQIGGGGSSGLDGRLQAIRNDIAALDAFEDAFIVRTPLGRADVRTAASNAQSGSTIDLPAAGVGAKLQVTATLANRPYVHSFDVAALRALPDAGTDPLSDTALNPPNAPNALRYQWDPDDSDSSLFVGHRSGKLVFSTASAGDTAWTVTDIRIRVVLNFQDLGNTPAGNIPASRNVETDGAGNVTYGELVTEITQLDGFPDTLTDGKNLIAGPGNTVIEADLPSGGGHAKFTDHSDTPSTIPAGGRVLRSTQAGGSLEFAGNVITETPQRLTALPVNPKDGRWWVADADIASQLGADTPVREDQTRNGVQEIIAAPVEVVDTIAYPVAIDTGIDGAVDVKLSSADFDSIRALPDTPVNTGPPQNTPITTFSAAQRIEKTVYNADGIPLNTLYLGHRGSRIWLSFQSAIGAAVTVKFFTGLQAEAGRHYVYISGRWEDWVHWLNQLRQAAVEAAIAADVIPASLNANSADRFPTAKMVRTMTAAEFAAATDQSGIISIPVT